MIQPQKPKGFFARYWGLLLGGAVVLFIGFVAVVALLYFFVVRGNAKVNSLELSDESIVAGKYVEARVEVINTGLMETTYDGTLLVDGKEKALESVTLESKKPQTITLDISDLKPGRHKFSIGDLSAELRILKPAEFKITDLDFKTDGILVGDTIEVSATVSNAGEVEGTYEAVFTYDGDEMDTQKIKVGPGAEVTFTATVKIEKNGTHAISLGDLKKTFSALNPANVALADFKLSKVYAKPGEAITVTAVLKNTGDIAGTFLLDLQVAGKSAHKESITVEPNSSKTFTFKVSQPKAGKYALKLGAKSATLYVVTITRPNSGTLLVKTVNGGYGQMTVTNNSSRDALLIMTKTSDAKKSVLTLYLRPGGSKKIKVKDGNYYCFYATGTDYDSSSKRFITKPIYMRFTGSMNFKTTYDSYYRYYDNWTVKLYDNSDDAAEVKEPDFPK